MPLIGTLSVVGIVYGSFCALAQNDIKKLVAYSSVAHLGFCMLGLFALNSEGITGGVLQMINHGLSTGALFLIVGMIYERRHTRMIADFGGLSESMRSIDRLSSAQTIALPWPRSLRSRYNATCRDSAAASPSSSASAKPNFQTLEKPPPQTSTHWNERQSDNETTGQSDQTVLMF